MKLYSFIKNKLSISKIPEPIPILSVCKLSKKSDLPGVELGIPLNIFQYISTFNHYGYSIINPQLLALQFLIGFYTYGKDRYYDAIAANKTGIGYGSKKELYDYILENKKLIKLLLDYSFFFIVIIISLSNTDIDASSPLNYETFHKIVNDIHIEQKLPFIAALLSTEFYSKIKENFGFLKSTYVASMWTMSSIILPAVIHDHDFSIFNYPLDYLPIFALIFSSSNLLDIKDIDEDKQNGIYTLPVLFGTSNSQLISIIPILLSSALILFNGFYSVGDALSIQKIILNIVLEIQNLAIILQAVNSDKKED